VNVVWPHGDPRDVAREIVAGPRYRGTTSADSPAPSVLERLLMWIGARFADLVHAIGHVLGSRSPVNVAVGILVLVVVAVALVFLIVRFVRLPSRRGRVTAASVALEGVATSAELVAEARAAARAERWHDAASLLARAALHALDERGRLHFDPARTPGEVRRLLGDPAFDAFEREATTALFAAHGATRERFERLRATYAAAFSEPV
jgi:hypothetical protein